MKAGWEVKTLDQISINLDNKRIPITKDKRTSGEYPYYGASGIVDYVSDYIFDEDTLLISEDGANLLARSTPIAFPASGKYWVNNHAHILKFDSAITQRFVELYFESIPLDDYITGAAQPKLNQKALNSIPIPVPNLPEQQRIVAILDAAFASIATAKANTEQNLKNARALFDSYLHEVFENPKDTWQKKKWGDLCDFVRGPFGGSLKKNIFKEEGYVVYEQKHAIHDHFNQLRYFIDEEKFNEMIRFEVKPGDIIMSCSGVTLGRVAIVPEGIKRGIINQALLKLTPKKNVYVHFIKHWLRSSIFQKIIFEFSGGAAIPNVPSAKILKDILIPLPSIEEQILIVSKIENMKKETQRLEAIYQRKLAALDELKKALLHQAFNGEL